MQIECIDRLNEGDTLSLFLNLFLFIRFLFAFMQMECGDRGKSLCLASGPQRFGKLRYDFACAGKHR